MYPHNVIILRHKCLRAGSYVRESGLQMPSILTVKKREHFKFKNAFQIIFLGAPSGLIICTGNL